MAPVLALILLGQVYIPGPDGIPVPDIPQFSEPAEPWMAPGRLFSVKVPQGWAIALHDDDPYTIDFRGLSRPGQGVLQVRRIVVPKGAHPRQLLLNAIETRLSKLPGFKIASRRNVVVAGHKGAAVVGNYAYQGNIQYPVAIEEVFVVTGEEAFVFHFECFEPAAPELAGDLNKFYVSFLPRPAALDVDPFAVPTPLPGGVDPDQVRF